jgi:uncharacterized protein (TIGR00369 family)
MNKEEQKAFFKKIFEEGIPLNKFLGIKVLELSKGYAKLLVPFREEVIGDVRSRHWHGGMIASALDSAGGLATGTLLTSFEDKIATLDMRVDYLKPGKEGNILVTGKVIRSGNRSIVTNLQAFQEATEELIADGRAVFSVSRVKNA